MEAIIREELERFRVPGAAVTAIRDGEIILCEGFGLRDIVRDLPVTPRTLFPIGSTTKAFTATVLGTFVDEGLLEWDRPVVDYFPDFRLHDPLVTQQVSLRDMLSHRTGLPGHDMLMFMYGDGRISRSELVQRLRYLPLNKGLRETWQYNNLIYMTAGYLTEVIAGITWEQAVTTRLLEPLGMASTGFSIEEAQQADDHSRPHAEKDGDVREIAFRPIEIVGPAGSIISSIEDMARWLSMNLDSGQQLVSAATLAEIQSPAMALPEAMPWEEVKLVGYGLGWVLEDYRGHRVAWHNGGIDGFKAMIAIVPERRTGVVVLANKFPTEAPEAIAYRALDELLGLDPIDWGARRRELEEQAAAAAAKERDERAAKKKDASPTHPLETYAGRYSHPGYGTIGFEVVDGELIADLHGLRVTLHHRHYNVWDALETTHDIVMPFVFQIDADGDIGKVEAELEPAVEPIVFKRAQRSPSEAE